MPINGFDSICEDHAPRIISQDRGNSQKHIAHNDLRSYVTHYAIDGVVIRQGNRCDYLLLNEDKNTAYLIELKGSDLAHAARQLEATENALRSELSQYNKHYRIVANKCKTQEIESTEFKKYRVKWGGKLKYGTSTINEDINK